MDTGFLRPNTAFSLSSVLIMLLLMASCSLFFLMYSQIFLVTSVRGMAFSPTTAARTPVGVIAFMNAAFGLRFAALFFFGAAFFAGLRAGAFFAGFLAFLAADFFGAFFAFFVAIVFIPPLKSTCRCACFSRHRAIRL